MSEQNKEGLIIVVTGLSGSGKSSALKSLEDHGFMAIDNLPVLLLPKLLTLRKESGDFIRLAVGMDARETGLERHHGEVFQEAREMGYEIRLLFLEADDQILVKRFSETRRAHPLAPDGGLTTAIALERDRLAPLRAEADLIVDTSNLSAPLLRELVLKRFVNAEGRRSLSVEVLSFGFKNGLPPEADLILDVRFLPNPYYVDKFRHLDGRDQEVKDYIMAFPEAHKFLEKLFDLIFFLLPLYQKAGKSYLTIAVGCTGGQHRSVAMAVQLWEKLKNTYRGSMVLRHRDIM
ncbi:MAG: RNase adapter RapZ [Deltaproteobacteria bacterium]|nr:RNase adapter RapZ [Deltaproteobacteria bacterium]